MPKDKDRNTNAAASRGNAPEEAAAKIEAASIFLRFTSSSESSDSLLRFWMACAAGCDDMAGRENSENG